MKTKRAITPDTSNQARTLRLPSTDMSEGQIRAFADAVLDGKADPGDAKRVLGEFLLMARPGNIVSDAMIGFLAEAIERFMRDECSIMEAFGLSKPRRRGRPPRDRAQSIEVAMHVLLLRAKGRKDATGAEVDAARKFALGTSVIRERVAKYGYAAIKEIRARATRGALTLTQKQRAKLDRLARVTVRPRTARHPTRNRLAAIPPEYSR